MKKLIVLLAAVFAVSLSGCNTFAGAGKDIERGGEKMQDASRKVRSDWRAMRERHEREYETTRTGCMTGGDAQREACRDRAHAAYVARMNEARATYKRNEMRAETEEDRKEEAYEAARNACDALRGADEDRCVAEARRRYGR